MPLVYHALEALFAVFGGTYLVGRLFFAAFVPLTVVLVYRVARRFVPPALAWIPGAVHALVPGPWHKAYYATCTAGMLLAAARAIERPTPLRFGVLGAAVGLSFVTRQDIGLFGFAMALGLAIGPASIPSMLAARDASPLAGTLRRSAAVLAGVALPVLPLAAYYASVGGLDDLVEATLVRSFSQMDAHPPVLARLLSSDPLGVAPEGRDVGVLMLLPLATYAGIGALVLQRLLRRGVEPATVFLTCVLGFGVAGLVQAYHPMLLLRLLQSALPFYLLATVAVWELARRFALPAPAAVAALVAAGAAFAGLVIWGLPGVKQPMYTGSARVLRLEAPVEIAGDLLYDHFVIAEEIRLARAFFDAHTAKDEPTVALPFHSLYTPILERPNPTRCLAEHPRGNFNMTAEMKREEAAKLLASPARFVVVDRRWWALPDRDDPLLVMLQESFHPVRGYGSVLILERGNDGDWPEMGARLRKLIARGAVPGDAAWWRRFAEAHPDEPAAWRMLAVHEEAAGRALAAAESLERAAALDPADATAWEASARLLAAASRRDAAQNALARARAIRESPETRRLAATLSGRGR
jgi:hypothetical protein